MKLKIKLMNIQNPNTFMEIVNKCKGKVELVGPDLRLNLKSKMSQLLSLAKLFDADVDLGGHIAVRHALMRKRSLQDNYFHKKNGSERRKRRIEYIKEYRKR